MNPLTLVKRIQKINSQEAALGISEQASWHAKYKDSAYVFVGGIPFDLTEGDLLAVFAQYGEIVDVNLVRDKGTGKSKGFAFVAYEDQRSTNLAVDNLNGAQILGRIIRVDHVSNYKKKEEEDEETERQKREARGVCRAFQRGECNRGAGCKFSHDEQRASNTGWGAEDKSSRWGHDKFQGSTKSDEEPNSIPTNHVHEPAIVGGHRFGNEDARSSLTKGSDRGRENHHRRSELDITDQDGRDLDMRMEQKEKELHYREDRDRRATERRSGRNDSNPSEDLDRRGEDQTIRAAERRSRRHDIESNLREVDGEEDQDRRATERRSRRADYEPNPREDYDRREEKRSRRSSMGSGSREGSSEWRAEEAIAGNTQALEALRELITFPLYYSLEAQKLGLKWPRGLLLYGPPGTGKTSLVRAVVRECGAHLTTISPHTVHRAHAGESEKILREAFSEASSYAMSGKPSVIFIDEIDALCPRRSSRREQDNRLASQLFTLMDSKWPSSASLPQAVVVASTNRVDVIDPALRRSGRFDAEIEVTTPTEAERFQILKLYTKKLLLDPDVDLQVIAASCNGYVGADLEALCREATLSAFRSCDANEVSGVHLAMDDWKHARSIVGPSITRGVTVEIPKVSWEDIGGLKDLKKKLRQAVEWPIKHSDAFARLGISPMRGILLHGPPGCSKTTLAKAAAHAAQASFFSLSGAELYSMYVGEGEVLLRNTFQRARLAVPSIIFFDEADVVASKRGGSSNNSSTVGERLLSTLLTEMDGLEEAKGILVLAATNRPHAIDAALMRPGRFDVVLYVPPPDLEGRHEILRVHTRNMKLGNDVDLWQIAQQTELFTGAELEGLCREAAIVALREDISAATLVNHRHFQAAKASLTPALTQTEIDSYSSFMKNSAPPSTPNNSIYKIGSKQVWVGALSFIAIAIAKYFITFDNWQQLLQRTPT